MPIRDFTPTYLAPRPSSRVLAVVHRKVTDLWIDDPRIKSMRPNVRDDLILAARFFDRRREVLEAEEKKDPEWRHWRRTSNRAILNFLALGLLGWLIALIADSIHNFSIFFRSFELQTALFSQALIAIYAELALFYQFHRESRFDPALELAEIESFDRVLPSIVAMAQHSGADIPVTPDIEAAANIPLGTPVTPPGLTELELSRDNSSLSAIRGQLAWTRRIDMGMTLVSFAAFIAGIALCIWELVGGGEIARSLIGIGGAGFVGLFCFYSTGRARSSQIALALFESCVAELTVSLREAALKFGEERSSLEKSAWQNFRIALNELHLLDRQTTKESAAQSSQS